MSGKLDGLLAEALRPCHEVACDLFGVETSGTIAARYYYWFDLFDAVQYPMMFGTAVGEADIVEIIRIAPEDAASLTSSAAERRQKLKGLAVAHFGAFLDRDWRVNDLLWGRLDAAERVISALLPWQRTKVLRDRLIVEAHSEIFREFGARSRLGEMAVRQAIKPGPRNRPQCRECRAGGRGSNSTTGARVTHCTSNFYENLERCRTKRGGSRAASENTGQRHGDCRTNARRHCGSARKIPARTGWITAIGRALWGLVEISVPPSPWWRLANYWQYLLLLIAVLLVIGGMLTGQAGIAVFGWVLIGGSVVLATLRWALKSFMQGRRLLVFFASVIIVVLVLLAAVGGWQLYQWGLTLYAHLRVV